MNDDWLRWLDLDEVGSLPTQDHAARRAALQGSLARLAPEDHTAALLVTGAANLRWATGFTGTNGALVVTPDGATLLTDARYEGRAATECAGLDVHITRELAGVGLRLASDAGVDRVAFEGDHVSHRLGTTIQAEAGELGFADVIAVHGVVEQHRLCKDDAELGRIARACAVTEAVLDDVLSRGLDGRTEREVATAIEDGFRAHEAQVGFATIVAAGPNGAVPHHEPTSRVIDAGDLVTIDCGARVDGYHADTTRTVAAARAPDDDLAEVFALVADAQQRGVEAVVIGVATKAVDAAARRHLEENGHGDAFVHGTGHGVGLDIHEAPAVAATSAGSLAARTVLTVEPGVYLPGRGGVRVEDTVVVTAEGPARRLTHSPRTLLVV